METSQTQGYTTATSSPISTADHDSQSNLMKTKNRYSSIAYVFVTLIIIGLVGSIFIAAQPKTSTPAPSPSDTPTPSPKNTLISPVATMSAYLDLTKQAASLSASINAVQTSDTSLIPPTIELPLGFPNQ